MRQLITGVSLGLATLAFHHAAGGPPAAGSSTELSEMSERFNLPLKTAGGTQFWTDHVWREGYRVQQNSITGHWRLLDPSDTRRAWGSREQCEKALDAICPPTAVPAGPRHVVVLLHGLMRTRHSMGALEQSLHRAGYENVFRMSYASTRRSIGDQAAALRTLLEGLPEETELSFVGHSMGNIVVRHMIGDLQRADDPAGLLPRCRAMVMLGPPNQGAAIARLLAPTGLYGIVTGPGGLQLGPQWKGFVDHLATPPFPFAIVVGDVSDRFIDNPFLKGKSDFIVKVDEALLPGAEQVTTVPAYHAVLTSDRQAMDAAVEFLKKH